MYQKAMKYFHPFKYHSARFFLTKINIDNRVNKLVKELEQEEYSTKKYFIDILFESSQFRNEIHPFMFNDIIIPVFIEEYNNNNPKYIKLIGDCISLPFLGEQLMKYFSKKNIVPEFTSGDSFMWHLYFYEKSYMLDRNQLTLDILMGILKYYIYTYRLDFPAWVTHPKHYMELLKPFEESMNKCKILCKISGNDKWNNLLGNWGFLIFHLYKYEEYVRKNGYVMFNDYLKEIGVKLF